MGGMAVTSHPFPVFGDCVMCSILGYKVLKHGDPTKAIPLFEAMLVQSQVRGKHATGVSWVSEGKVKIFKSPVPAKDFIGTMKWLQVSGTFPMEMIGHCRYSTSGIDCQPVGIPGMSLVHNGIVSMADKDALQRQYEVEIESDNDSEVILHKMMEAYDGQQFEAQADEFDDTDALAWGLKDLYDRGTPIYALAVLNEAREIRMVRDHVRPLWFFYIKEWEIMGFASTEDIIRRTFKQFKDIPEHGIWEAEPYKIYRLGMRIGIPSDMLQLLPDDVQYASSILSRVRYTPKPLVDDVFIDNATYTLKGRDLDLDSSTYNDGDHRLNKRESFKRYCAAAVKTNEIDPNYPLMQYLFKRYELSESQQYWACWLYGVFYHPGTVFYVMQEFPEYELVDIKRLEKWHAANWKSLRYNTDRKYEKGHFVEMFRSYRQVIGGQTPSSQSEFFERHFTGTPFVNFHALWKSLNTLVRFGRYSLFIYTECLARCMGIPIDTNTLFLKESDSPRAGLAYVLDKPEYAKGKLTIETWTYFETEVQRLIAEVNREYPSIRMDYWFMESCLCAYKGLFRETKGRYIGYYIDRMAGEILEMSEEPITSGIEWTVLWQFRKESFPWEYLGEYATPPRLKVQKNLEFVFRDTGRLIGLWPCVKRGLFDNK